MESHSNENNKKNYSQIVNKVFYWISVSIGFLSLILFVLPILYDSSNAVYGFALTFAPFEYEFSINVLLIILLPAIGSSLLLLKNKIKDIELVSLIFYLLATILLFTLPNFASLFANVDIAFITSPYTLTYAIFLALSCLLIFYLLNSQNQYSVYEIVEAATLIALAVGLDLDALKISLGASGGSISFTTVPLAILALRQGPYKGFIGIGIIYGLITCLFDGWGLYTYPFDYLLAYGSIALLGFFKPLIIQPDSTKYTVKSVLFLIVGSLVVTCLRLLFATLSGIILYETPFVESLAYNALYVLPSGGIMLVLLIALYKPLCLLDRLYQKRTNIQIEP